MRIPQIPLSPRMRRRLRGVSLAAAEGAKGVALRGGGHDRVAAAGR